MEACSVFSSKEVRRLVRQQLSGNHGIQASVEIEHEHIPVTLSDISSLGFAALIQAESAHQFHIGSRITIKITPLKGQEYFVNGVVIDKQQRVAEAKIACLIQHDQSPGHGSLTALELGSGQYLKGQFSHPFYFQQNYFFDLDSISKQGFTITNIDSGCLLLSGMKLRLKLGVCDSTEVLEGVISEVTLTDSNLLRCFVRVPRMSRSTAKQITQHLFQHLDITPVELKHAGFKAYCVKELVHYKFVETKEEYEQVLRVRRKNYSGNQKVAPDTPLEKMSYFFDEYSQILMACHQDKVIGSATMIVGNPGIQPNEIETLLSEEEVAKLPDGKNSVEIACFCLNEEYRNTDILHGLFEHIYINAVMTGRRYLLISSDFKLLRLYKGIGFKETGCGFVQPKYNDLPMKILVVDKLTAKWGKGMNPLAWWFVWGKSSSYLQDRGVIRYSPLERARVQVSRALFSMALVMRNGYRRIKEASQSVSLGKANKIDAVVTEYSGNRA